MKPKHLFYGSAVLALVIALLYAIQGSVGLALLLLLVASCCLLNTRRAGSDRAASWADVKRMFGVR
jgi:hypothetical protein